MTYQNLLSNFEENLYLALKCALHYINKNSSDIFAFAINISDDLVNINIMANTLANFKDANKWFVYDFDLELTRITTEINNSINNIQNILDTLSHNFFNFFSGENYDKVKRDLIFSTIKSIKKAKNSLEFDTFNILFFVTMISDDDRLSIENLSAQEINSNEDLLISFQKRC